MEDKKHSFMDQLNLLFMSVCVVLTEIMKNMISVWNYQ